MSHMWMVMPGQSWAGATASFVGMWTVMMAAMMLPSLTPTLWRYRRTNRTWRNGWATALVGLGYFAVWAALGAIVFPLGVVVAGVVMREPGLARVLPMVVSAVVLIAGLVQLTSWKARYLALCRGLGAAMAGDNRAAWRHGLCLGLHCVRSCASLTAVALCLGAMDLRVMAVVTVAITAERLAPNGARTARLIGVVVIAIGLSTLPTAR